MSHIGEIFKKAARAWSETPKSERGEFTKTIYIDCGGTLFDNEKNLNKELFNFAVALKKAGHDVRFMSETPEAYKPAIKERLKEMSIRKDFFRDADDITVSNRAELRGKRVFVLIENDHPYLHGIGAFEFVNTTDIEKSLGKYDKHKKLPDSLMPKVLFG